MLSSTEAQKLTKKPPNDSALDGQTESNALEIRSRRTKGLRAHLKVLYFVIVILLILLFITTGFAIYFGIEHYASKKAIDDQKLSIDPLKNLTNDLDELVNEALKQRVTKNVRLPHNILPRFYDLRLQVHLQEEKPTGFFYNGSVQIEVHCRENTDTIFVHAFLTLNVSQELIKVETTTAHPILLVIKNITYDEELQWYEIKLVDKLQSGQNYLLTFGQFRAPLRMELKGWYLSSYIENGVEKHLATSQLQPTDARRVFPCWDEPAFKARFRVTLIRNKDYHSLSNMPLEKTEAISGDWFADVFQPTVNTSTYLLAFVVSQFHALSGMDSKGRNFTVWARPNVIHTARYALETGQKIIRFFEEYFEVPYPLEKTDMIAVPDFAAGAMENWGLMIYREATMLWDSETGTAASQQKVATVISHEIAHQWFGNLVTLTWWDDLWLNEGFASFAEAIGVHHVHPEWGMDEQFLLDDIQKVLVSDSVSTSRPVIQSVNFPNEINDIFDPISYNKGASVLRMMQSFMGTDVFRLGVKRYLSDYMFKNAVHDDLWKSMTEASKEHGNEIDVKSIMETWLLQMNYPLVTVERIGPKLFLFTQSHYLDSEDAKLPNNPSKFNFTWHVPLTYGYPASSDWERNEVLWLKDKSMTTHVEIDQSSWYIFNVRQAGFYRVHYADSNWLHLTNQLLENPEVIPIHSRAQIFDDLFNLVNRGTVPYGMFLNLTKYLPAENTYVAWETARRAFRLLYRMLAMDSSFGMFLAYFRTLIDRPLRQVDWITSREDKDHMTHMLRGTIVKLACQAGHRDCVNKAKQMYRVWMEKNSTNEIPSSLRGTIYCTAIHWGGQVEWQFLQQQLSSNGRDDETRNIQYALSCTRDLWIMKHYLNTLLQQENYDPSDLLDTVTWIALNPIGNLLMWDHIRDAWRRISAETNDSQKTVRSDSTVLMILKILSKRLYTINNVPPPELVGELEQILLAKMQRPVVLRRSFKEVFKRVEENRNWTMAHREVIHKWLKDNVPNDTILL